VPISHDCNEANNAKIKSAKLVAVPIAGTILGYARFSVFNRNAETLASV
jgi:hypothetical protein